MPTIPKLNYWVETNCPSPLILIPNWLLSSFTRVSCRQVKLGMSKTELKICVTHTFFSISGSEWYQYPGVETGNLNHVGDLPFISSHLVMTSYLFTLLNTTVISGQNPPYRSPCVRSCFLLIFLPTAALVILKSRKLILPLSYLKPLSGFQLLVGQRLESLTRPRVAWSSSLSSIILRLASPYSLCFILTDVSVDCVPCFRAFAHAAHLS